MKKIISLLTLTAMLWSFNLPFLAMAADPQVTLSINKVTPMDMNNFSPVTLGTIKIQEDPGATSELINQDVIYIILSDGISWDQSDTKIWTENLKTGSITQYSRNNDYNFPKKNELKIKLKNIGADQDVVYIEPVITCQGYQKDTVTATVTGLALKNTDTILVAQARNRGEGKINVTADIEYPTVISGKKAQILGVFFIEEEAPGLLNEDDKIIIELLGGASFNTEGTSSPIASSLQSGSNILGRPQVTGSKSAEILVIRASDQPISVKVMINSADIALEAEGAITAKVMVNKTPYTVTLAEAFLPEDKQPSVFMVGSKTYKLNGQQQEMDAAPYIKDGRVYLPLRYVAYALGIEDKDIGYNALTRKVSLKKDSLTVVLQIGERVAQVGNYMQENDVAPEIVDGRTMLPARLVVEAFGGTIEWNAKNQSVTIMQEL